MTVQNYSAWTYGHTVTTDNNTLPFIEGVGPELNAELNIGSYTLESFANEIARAMNSIGTLNYICTVDRNTRLLTVSGDSPFDLLVTSSTVSSVSPFPLMGFLTERSGASSYVGDTSSGEYFLTQFLLQSYVDFVDFQEANSVTVSQSATGRVQVSKYGNNNFMECNITLQTNIPQGKDSIIRSTNGYDELLAFMQYAVTKAPMEFIPDYEVPNTYTDCILEKTPGNSTGTGFKLNELFTKGFVDWWETGKITFREIK